MNDLPRSSVKRDGVFVSLIVGVLKKTSINWENNIGILRGDTQRHCKTQSVINSSQYSRSFSDHVPVPPHALWCSAYICMTLDAPWIWLQFRWKADQLKEVVTTLIEEMYPYKNPKVLSIDKIIKPDKSAQMMMFKAPRKLTTRCSEVWHSTSAYQTIQMIVNSTFKILECPCLYLPTAMNNFLHPKTIAMALWIRIGVIPKVMDPAAATVRVTCSFQMRNRRMQFVATTLVKRMNRQIRTLMCTQARILNCLKAFF